MIQLAPTVLVIASKSIQHLLHLQSASHIQWSVGHTISEPSAPKWPRFQSRSPTVHTNRCCRVALKLLHRTLEIASANAARQPLWSSGVCQNLLASYEVTLCFLQHCPPMPQYLRVEPKGSPLMHVPMISSCWTGLRLEHLPVVGILVSLVLFSQFLFEGRILSLSDETSDLQARLDKILNASHLAGRCNAMSMWEN